MPEENRLTRNQKSYLISCVGLVSVCVLAAMSYLVPKCVKLISEA